MQKLKRGLILEGVFSIVLAVLMYFFTGISNGLFLLSLPFELTGAGLRRLSLSSDTGNILAMIIYIFFSLIPILFMTIKIKKHGWNKIDIILPITSVYSFYMIYCFINPWLIGKQFPEQVADPSFLSVETLSLSIVYYSFWISYAILHAVRRLSTANLANNSHILCKGLQKILFIITVIYTFFLGYFSTFQLFADMNKNRIEKRAAINDLFLLIKYLLDSLPVLFTILILISGILLLESMFINRPEEEMAAAHKLGMISRRTVYITIISNIALNMIQILLSGMLNDTNYHLDFSFTPLIISFSAMILSGYFKKTKSLMDDNELFI